MSDIKLYRLTAGQATELQGDASDLEKPLQTLIENNLNWPGCAAAGALGYRRHGVVVDPCR